ncbi:hypothetical protein Sjap_004371 [Stephania japonica]|uniref:Hydroxyisourate hydrolase n=1 Tax=Stephania japonica TaxID=461633 RepID=A0AAP0K3N4_9MAGN
MASSTFEAKDFLACCGSGRFAEAMSMAGPFESYDKAVEVAREIWFTKVDVSGWLEAFAAHPQIGDASSGNPKSEISAQWSKGEQSTAIASASTSSLQELYEWNALYRQKFGHVFLICASGRTTSEILTELKSRYPNRPTVEFEIAAQEQMKITELRMQKLFSSKVNKTFSSVNRHPVDLATKVGEDRVSIIGSHLAPVSEPPSAKPSPQAPIRTRPPITTHILDVSRGSPACGVEIRLEVWKGAHPRPIYSEPDLAGWVFVGSSITNSDGRCGQLMDIVDNVDPGIYRISFNTGKYFPTGFFPYVSLLFEIKESQISEHFHVPLLLSPFSFVTYRGS